MKNTLLLLLFLTSFHARTQSTSIESQILDTEGNEVPFAAIGIINKNFGAITYEDGTFSIKVDEKYLEDTLVVSALGYQQRKISYRQFVKDAPETIKVRQSIQELNEVVITPESLSFIRLGEKRQRTSNSLTFLTPQKGTTLAVLFNESSDLMQVKDVVVSVGSHNLDGFQLRCMIFSVGKDTFPDQQLLNENLIQTFDNRKGTIRFEMTNFWIDKPFYVGFEWIVTKEQHEEMTKVRESFPLPFVEEIKNSHPDLKFGILDNKKVVLRNTQGEVKKEIELTKSQRAKMKERDDVNPRMFFQTKSGKGPKMVLGSYITNAWRFYPSHALVSILAGMDAG